jgi:hypothetical protein
MSEADRSDTPATDLAHPRKPFITRLWPRAAVGLRLSFYYGRGAPQSAPVMKNQEKKVPFDPKVFLATVNGGRSISKYRKNETVFSQSSSADAICGREKVSKAPSARASEMPSLAKPRNAMRRITRSSIATLRSSRNRRNASDEVCAFRPVGRRPELDGRK